MACPSCGATMQGLRDVIFWCPRCGAIADHSDGGMFERPQLVYRCRQFEESLTPLLKPLWHSLGIGESLHTPDQRDQP